MKYEHHYIYIDFILSRYFHQAICTLCLQYINICKAKGVRKPKIPLANGIEERQELLEVKTFCFNRNLNTRKWIYAASSLCFSVQVTLKEIIFY